MRVLVAGATGAIGRQLVPELAAQGDAVVGLARSPERAEVVRALGAEPIIGDVLDRDALEEAVLSEPGIDGVVPRCGYFDGPGTAYGYGGSMIEDVRAGRLAAGAFGVRLMTRLRAVSNHRVKAVLGWTPLFASWREGLAADLQGEPATEGVSMHAGRGGSRTWS